MRDTHNHADQGEELHYEEEEVGADTAGLLTLEICFLALVGVVVLAAFLEALSYQLVSSRTPFVIMVPLAILLVFHARRLAKHRAEADFGHRLKLALSGELPAFNKVVAMSGWLLALLAMVIVLGHYAGIAIFAFVLMRVLGRQELRLSLVVTAVATFMLFLIFEIGFDVELYRGLIFRYLTGYRDF